MARKDITPEKAKAMYVDEGMSIEEIARQLNVSTSTISSRLKKVGVKVVRLPHRLALDSKLIKDLYLSGRSTNQIAAMLNVSKQVVQYRLRELKVAMRINKGENNNFYKGGAMHHFPASQAVKRAIINGKLKRPSKCEDCQKERPRFSDGRSSIQAHHYDYNKYLDVTWLCILCHKDWHRNNEAIPFRKAI